MTSSLDQPRTLMFMSVDVVNSTAFKERMEHTETGPAWLDPFRKFFREFPLILMGRVALCFDDATSIPEISLWRIAGDEMVFVARPESEQETLFLFESLYQAFRHYHAKLSTDYGLGLKACCWSADFPQKNIAIGIPEIASRGDGSEDAYTEYLGPDVDLGFRIAKHVHGGEAIASLQLAETLARANDRRGVEFRFAGSAVLKGVNYGKPYPLITAGFSDRVQGDAPISGHQYSVDSGSIGLSFEEVIALAASFNQRVE